MGHQEENLDARQEQLILSLLREKTKEEAAAKAGIAHSTMYRWLQDTGFQSAYRRARRDAFDDAITSLLKAAKASADTLAGIVDAEDLSPWDLEVFDRKIKAATKVLDFAFKAYNGMVTDDRINELEMRYADLMAKVKA